MDYQALSMLVPKPAKTWTFIEIRKWLHFINMQKFIHLFENNNFDGELLSKITIKTLSSMGINSNIQQKKFMTWIEKGFIGFDNYLSNSNMNKQNICPNLYQRKTTTQKQNKRMPLINNKPLISEQVSHNKLLIKNYEGSQTEHHFATKRGLKIGRSTSNDVKCLEMTISDRHAKIFAKDMDFFIADLGTKHGTFIKVHHNKIQLLPQMLIELGSFLFTIKETITTQKQINVQCLNLNTDMKEELTFDFTKKPSFYFGRRNNNDFARDDQHMSGTHAKITFSNGKFILEDMGSTNGTWLRLSEPYKESKGHKIEDGTIFKIGNTITYICSSCSQKKEESRMQLEENSHICLNCNDNQRDILFLPCRHSLSCEKCCQWHTHCPLCNHEIEQKLKMFI